MEAENAPLGGLGTSEMQVLNIRILITPDHVLEFQTDIQIIHDSDLPWSPASHSLVCQQLDFSENRIIFSCMLRQKFCGDLAFKKGCRPHLKRKCRCNAKNLGHFQD